MNPRNLLILTCLSLKAEAPEKFLPTPEPFKQAEPALLLQPAEEILEASIQTTSRLCALDLISRKPINPDTPPVTGTILVDDATGIAVGVEMIAGVEENPLTFQFTENKLPCAADTFKRASVKTFEAQGQRFVCTGELGLTVIKETFIGLPTVECKTMSAYTISL